MRRTLLPLALSLVLLGLGAAAADASTWSLQYARQPGVQVPGRLVSRLEALGLKPRGFQALPMVIVSGPDALMRRAARAPGVLWARRADRVIHFDLDRSVPLVFEGTQNAQYARGFDGRGSTVAVVDTGIDATHPDLGPQVVKNVEFAFSGSEFARTLGLGLPPLVLAEECPVTCNTDQFGHGTHVAGIVGGLGTMSAGRERGVAPGTKLVGLSISETGTTLEFYALAGFDYLLAHPELNVDVVNNSWGLNEDVYDPRTPVNQAAKMLHDRGITVVFAAGNNGPNTGDPRKGTPASSSNCTGDGSGCRINTNSVSPWVVSVAAGDRVEGGGGEAQHLAPFSSRGDAQNHVVDGLDIAFKPDLTAPGTGILATADLLSPLGNPATCAAVGDLQRCTEDRDPATLPWYTALSGTSMASPHVAGAVAVLQSAARTWLGRPLKPDEVRDLLVRTAIPMKGKDAETKAVYADWQVGAGYLDVKAALDALDVMAHPPAPPAVAKPKAKKKAKPKAKKKARPKAKSKKKPKAKRRN